MQCSKPREYSITSSAREQRRPRAYRLMKPTMIRRMTAPIVALTMEPMNPANGTIPNCCSSLDTDESTDDAKHDVPNQAITKAAHNITGQPASDCTDDQRNDDAVNSDHDDPPLGGIRNPVAPYWTRPEAN